jgi:hypothetical protein
MNLSEIRPTRERALLRTQDELISLPASIETFEYEAIAAMLVEFAANADAETCTAVGFVDLKASQSHCQCEATVLGDLMSQRMHTPSRTRVEAFGTAFTDTPVFHWVRPKLATKEDTIMGLRPVGRRGRFGQNWGLPTCDACEGSSSDEFEAVSASDFRCHVHWERFGSSAFSTILAADEFQKSCGDTS